jgi:hypothetical protein
MNKALLIGGSIVVGSLLGIAAAKGVRQITRAVSDAKSVKDVMESTGISKKAAKAMVKEYETLNGVGLSRKTIAEALTARYNALAEATQRTTV